MKYLLTIILFMSVNVFADIKYKVCWLTDITKLEKCVNEFMNEGFVPHGSLKVIQNNNRFFYWQPLKK